jgi:serine/arginine repetitive matrix protein 2
MQAQSSFGNKQARTLVKARSKSLVNGRRRGHQTQTSLDYLAAQACLGNQNLHPSLSTNDLYTTNANPTRKTSYSRNASYAPTTLSRPSKSHSRNDSWSKPAVKMAMSTAAICGFPGTEDDVIVMDTGDARAASLEGALKRDGTKVIRLADPVHLPVDHRGSPPINTSPESSIRLSPTPSTNGSDRRVAIALGTPPLRDDQSDSYFHPSHPYAQGGLSFSVPGPSTQTRIDRGVGFAGPHPSINSGVDVSQIPDTLARHKLPPHLYLHPYAKGPGPSRDSYFDQNGLLAHFRSGDETPHQNKMWAQLSPGILREVLPNDIQYSPFTPPPPPENSISPVSANLRDSMVQINDTIGVGETLANAESVRRSHGTGTGTNDDDSDIIPVSQVDGDERLQNGLSGRTIRQPIEHNLLVALSEVSEDALVKPSLTSQIVSSHPLKQHSPTSPSPLDHAVATSPTFTSSSSSPPLTPGRLGSLNDLDGFQDLFYRPSNDIQRTPIEAALPDTPSPPHLASWDRVRRNKAESGLTSLARQLSQEFELITQERERTSQHSSPILQQQRGATAISRQPTVRSLNFVSEEATSHSKPVSELDLHHTIQAFQPSDSLPEDVESSRTSSVIESSDETSM